MKLHVLSDLHLELSNVPFQPVARTVRQADVIVLAGDIATGTLGVEWAIRAFPNKPVIYVLGNHEFYGGHISKVALACKQVASGTNVHVLDNDALIVDGVRFLGATLWTDFELFGNNMATVGAALHQAGNRINDFSCITFGSTGWLKPAQSVILHRASREWLAKQLALPHAGPTVVVTHHAPCIRSIAAKWQKDILSAGFASRLDDLVIQSDLWIHGHTHTALDYRLGDEASGKAGRVICNPRGYAYLMRGGEGGEQTGWDSRLLLDLPEHSLSEALDIVVAQAKTFYGDKLARVVLLGSATRPEDFRADSDVDVAILYQGFDHTLLTKSRFEDQVEQALPAPWAQRLEIAQLDQTKVEPFRDYELCFEGQVLRGRVLYDAGLPFEGTVLDRAAARQETILRYIGQCWRWLNLGIYLHDRDTTAESRWESSRAACRALHAVLILHDLDPSPKSIRWHPTKLLEIAIHHHPELVRLRRWIHRLPADLAHQSFSEMQQTERNVEDDAFVAQNRVAAAAAARVMRACVGICSGASGNLMPFRRRRLFLS